MESVVFDNGRTFVVGYAISRFNSCGEQYVEVAFGGNGKSSAMSARTVWPLEQFMALVKKSGFGVCPKCSGTGKIDPIENPPYECDFCTGKGFFTEA